MERIKENTPELQTERLILRQFTKDDIAEMRVILAERETNTFLPWFPIDTLQETEQFLYKNYLDTYSAPVGYKYAICQKTDNIPIGYVHLSENESFDLGYGLHRNFWHKGIVTEAAAAVAERIAKSGLPFITATHDVHNPRSGEVMKKIGMKYCYTYETVCQPKNETIKFRMYQLNFDAESTYVYKKYWNNATVRCVESIEESKNK